jgi:hypothetical protein
VRRATGLSVSAALKRGLAAARDELRRARDVDPWAVYAALDLGPGGEALGPARRAKDAIRRVLRRRRR